MNVRDIINRKMRRSNMFPVFIVERIGFLFFFALGCWYVWQERETSPWLFRFGFLAFATVTALDFVSYSKPYAACPHCQKPLLLSRSWSRLPSGYRFCPACGVELEKKVSDDKA